MHGILIKESIIDQTYSFKISPDPSFLKRGIPPFGKGREGGISSSVSIQL
jgi:hypothetical protein